MHLYDAAKTISGPLSWIFTHLHYILYFKFQPRERQCIHMSLRNMSVFTAPAPFGGPQLLTALQLLQNTNLTQHPPMSSYYHSFIEAIRRSYAGFVKLGRWAKPEYSNYIIIKLSYMCIYILSVI